MRRGANCRVFRRQNGSGMAAGEGERGARIAIGMRKSMRRCGVGMNVCACAPWRSAVAVCTERCLSVKCCVSGNGVATTVGARNAQCSDVSRAYDHETRLQKLTPPESMCFTLCSGHCTSYPPSLPTHSCNASHTTQVQSVAASDRLLPSVCLHAVHATPTSCREASCWCLTAHPS